MKRLFYAFIAAVMLSALILPVSGVGAAPDIITIIVQNTNGNPLSNFDYIINENNIGDPDAPADAALGYSLLWPSVRQAPTHSRVVATGNQASAAVDLPSGKYLISVKAPGHKIGGRHIILPGDAGQVIIQLTPHYQPLATIRAHVFHDNMVNGEDDVPLEFGLEGFVIGITDAAGDVTVCCQSAKWDTYSTEHFSIIRRH